MPSPRMSRGEVKTTRHIWGEGGGQVELRGSLSVSGFRGMQDHGPIILFTHFVCREFLRLGTFSIHLEKRACFPSCAHERRETRTGERSHLFLERCRTGDPTR